MAESNEKTYGLVYGVGKGEDHTYTSPMSSGVAKERNRSRGKYLSSSEETTERSGDYVSGLFYEVERSEDHTYTSLQVNDWTAKKETKKEKPTSSSKTEKIKKTKCKGSNPTKSKARLSGMNDYETLGDVLPCTEHIYGKLDNFKRSQFDVKGFPTIDNRRFGIVDVYVLRINKDSIDLIEKKLNKSTVLMEVVLYS